MSVIFYSFQYTVLSHILLRFILSISKFWIFYKLDFIALHFPIACSQFLELQLFFFVLTLWLVMLILKSLTYSSSVVAVL